MVGLKKAHITLLASMAGVCTGAPGLRACTPRSCRVCDLGAAGADAVGVQRDNTPSAACETFVVARIRRWRPTARLALGTLYVQ